MVDVSLVRGKTDWFPDCACQPVLYSASLRWPAWRHCCSPSSRRQRWRHLTSEMGRCSSLIRSLGCFHLVTTDNINGYNPISKWSTYALLPLTDDQFVFCVRSAPRHIGQCIGGCNSEPRHAPYLFLWDCKKSQWPATFCDNDRKNIPDRVTADHLLLHNHNNSGWNALTVTK